MSVLDRIIPWRRAQTQHTSLVGETHAARDTLAASLEQIAQAMEERFTEVMERIDAEKAERAEESAAARAQLDTALSEIRRSLDAQIGHLSAAIEAGRADRAFALALRDLKRELSAQISLGAHDVAAELGEAAAALNRSAGGRSTDPDARDPDAEHRNDLVASAHTGRPPPRAFR